MKIVVVTLSFAFLISSMAAAGLVQSTFDASGEGWLVVDITNETNPPEIADTYTPPWTGLGGNPGGFIWMIDPSHNVFKFAAPEKFLGDQSGAYNGLLMFDMRQLTSGSSGNYTGVTLFGGGKTLYRTNVPYPTADWTTVTIELTVDPEWHLNSPVGPQATETDWLTVLSSLEGIHILADWVGPHGVIEDETGLDNVILVPECALGPQGRLLIPGPTGTGADNEIHSFDLATGSRTVFATFGARPIGLTLGHDGLLYVVLQNVAEIYKLDRQTGAIVDSFPITIPGGGFYNASLVCKPDGNILVYLDAGNIDEYGPDGSYLGTWGDPVSMARDLQLSPVGTIVILCPNKIVEYDLDGTYLRDIIPPDSAQLDSYVWADAAELLVWNRTSSCVERYDWTTTPATLLGDFVCPAGSGDARWLVTNGLDGSIYATSHSTGCIHGWADDGTALYDGDPLGACYGGAFYCGARPIIIAEDCNENGCDDRREIETGLASDCNGNMIPDDCDIATGDSADCDSDAIPDECEDDSDTDGLIDDCDNCPDVENPNQCDFDEDGQGDACDADDDDDGVDDGADLCPYTIPGVSVDADGCPPWVPGDADRDGDVDLIDFAMFQECMAGPNQLVAPECATPRDPCQE